MLNQKPEATALLSQKWGIAEFRNCPLSNIEREKILFENSASSTDGGQLSRTSSNNIPNNNSDKKDEEQAADIYVTRDGILRRLAKIERQIDFAGFLGTIYVSHSLAYRPDDVTKVAIELAKLGYYVTDFRESLNDSRDIEFSDIFVMFFSENYENSMRNGLEIQYALKHRTPIVVVNMDRKPPDDWPFENVKLDRSDICVEFPSTRQYDEFIAEFLALIKEFTPSQPKEVQQDNEDEAVVIARRKKRDKMSFQPIDVPVFAKYYTRREDELRLSEKIVALCQHPESGVLIVSGEAGIGKTSLIARIFTSKANNNLLMNECNIHLAFWVNCQEWRDERASFTPANQKAFLAKVLEVAKKTDPLVPSFFNLSEVFFHFNSKERRPILILDNVVNAKLLQFVRNQSKLLPCLVITNDQSNFKSIPSNCIGTSDVVKPLSEAQLLEMFEVTFAINGLPTAKLAKLAARCLGCPLIARLVASRFIDRGSEECDQQFSHVLNDLNNSSGHQVQGEQIFRIVKQLFTTSLQQMDESQRVSFNAFLFYEPEEAIVSEDAAFLWGFEGEELKTKARALCRLFAKRGLILQLTKDIGEQDDRYVMHPVIYDVAISNAKRVLKATDLTMIRLRLVTGSARVEGDDYKEPLKPKTSGTITSAKTPDIDVLCGVISLQRFNFLVKIFEKIGPLDLSVLCGQTSPKIRISGRNFLHHLYRSTWKSDEILLRAPRDNQDLVQCLPNSSYRLIDSFLQRLTVDKVAFVDIFRKFDIEQRCLLLDLFDDEHISTHQKDRLSIICRLSKWRGDYLLAQYRKNKDNESAEMLKAIVRGDVQQISLQQVDANGETSLMIAAKLGLVSVVETLAVKQWETICQQNKDGMTAVAIASYYGQLNVLQSLFKANHSVMLSCLKTGDAAGRTPLMFAARNGHLDVVEFLCNKEPSVIMAQDNDGFTALIHSSIFGHVAVVMILQSRNSAAAQMTSNDGRTAMMQAAAFGQLEIVQFLTDKYPEAMLLCDKDGLTAMMLAAASGYFDIAHYLYEKEPAALKMRDIRQRTGLMLAARGGHLEAVEFLFSRDVDGVKHVDIDNWTPLMYASANGNLDCVQFLFSHYPQAAEEANNDDETPMMVAAENGNFLAVQYLYAKFPEAATYRNKNGYSALMLAAENGHLNVIDFIHSKHDTIIALVNREDRLPLTVATIRGKLNVIKNLYDKYPRAISEKDNLGWTPLMHAVQHNYLQIVQYLHEQADGVIKFRDLNGMTPLMLAASLGFLDVAIYLTEQYPDALKRQDNDGHTAMMHAAINGHLAMCQFLHGKAPDTINMRNNEGQTTATLAAMNNQLSCLAFLGEKYPLCLRLQDNDGWSPMMRAADRNHLGVVRFLCERLPDAPEVLNNDKQPALFLAAASGHLDVVRFLFAKWPKAVHMEDVNQKTALKLAIAGGHVDVVEFLHDII